MLEQSMVAYCAPTLAAMATGNLFTYAYEDLEELQEQIDRCNRCVNQKGVLLRLLRAKDHTALVYVFRPKKLWEDLRAPGVMEFLVSIGYQPSSLCSMIRQLAHRVDENGEFPHEIGIFLGYPLGDVKGFIENKGNNYKIVGYWKVYNDEISAKKLFEKFRLCTRLYGQRFLQGITLQQLTVAA